MKIIKVFTDGGARGNPGPAAAGVAIEGLAEKERLLCGKYLGHTTNNVAEYSAVVLAYETLLEQDLQPAETTIEFFMDSNLVAQQLSGIFKIKNPNLATFVTKIKAMEKQFFSVSYTHIPREKNKLADHEVNKVLDSI